MIAVTPRRFIVFGLGLIPFLWLVWCTLTNQLGADPAKTIVWETGRWALRILLVTLAVSPLRRYAGWGWLMPHRRMIGLFALFYGVLHLLAYIFFILGGNLSQLGEELVRRPYITVGAPALLILIALGVTSTRGMMKRLGKNWQRLHNLVYLALILAWIHLLWQVRSSYFEAALYGTIGAALLLVRVVEWMKKRAKIARQNSANARG
ncbi:sulfite oxidase heme-binding subunit YedZ [Pokkaliibacter sp. CJK22405]|uniref:sulfite oxidase heme-binding subunit YedZ n=1 Tax=Pokkaliibacter sp. CJK22405 TaxID=3384615 RepID=UPI0039852A47